MGGIGRRHKVSVGLQRAPQAGLLVQKFLLGAPRRRMVLLLVVTSMTLTAACGHVDDATHATPPAHTGHDQPLIWNSGGWDNTTWT
jgi:hypothetical protein